MPKTSTYAYGEAIYRTVQAGEVVQLGASYPDFSCLCAGQPREWAVYGLDGKFIGYLWQSNLNGVTPAPLPPPPPTGTQWTAARLLPPNYGRVVSLTNCPLLVGVTSECGPKYPYGQYRTPEIGEIVALYTNGWGWAAGGGPIWTVYSITHGDTLIVYGADMQGLAPAPGTPEPALPAGWFAGVLKTATKTCGPIYGPDYGGGVTAGVAYRLWFPASGGYVMPMNVDAFVSAVPAADPHFGTFAGVAAGCFL